MSSTGRPLSPHLGIYRWQIQMVTSILHRATGIALAAGSLLLLAWLCALAAGPDAYAAVRGFCSSWIGIVLLIGWSWSLSYHLLNGIRHLLQDAGLGFAKPVFVRNGFIVVAGSIILTALIWACVLLQGGAA
ncbi:MAG TPA: succinate dehydrogenase, cytochrome b556 subunit [Rhodanobacteraceae bacterium]|nr:succinate dehydrogenase, cytochrome b556 subunit [Rhodanobacteraceae bacterium]